MRIDPSVEEHVREAFASVVGRDRKRMTAAIDGLSGKDTQTALSYAVFVCGYVVNDVYPNGPTDQDVLDLAKDIIDGLAEWVDLGETKNVAAFLTAAAKGDTTFPGFPKEDLLGHALTCGAYLLSTRRLEDQRWWQYLDAIWAAAETAPDPY